MNEQEYRECNRCKQKKPTLLYTVHTKQRGKEEIIICQDCMQTLVECLLSYRKLDWSLFKCWCNGAITTNVVVRNVEPKL